MITVLIFLILFCLSELNVVTLLVLSFAAEYVALLLGSYLGTWFTLNILFGLVVFLLAITFFTPFRKKVTARRASLSLEMRNPALYALIILNVIVFLLALSRIDMAWDEYAHWGHTIKYLVSMGRLPDASAPPVGHGAPWYPWGLGIYSVALSYPFIGVSRNVPIIVNCLFLLLVGYKTVDFLDVRDKYRHLIVLVLYLLLVKVCSPSWLNGYADFSLTMAGLLSMLYLFAAMDSSERKDARQAGANIIGLAASLVLLVSLKESGKYLATLVMLSALPMVFRLGADVRVKLLLRVGLSYVFAMALTLVWSVKAAEFSPGTSREVGFYLYENIASSRQFMLSAIKDIWKSPHLYIPILAAFAISTLAGLFLNSGQDARASRMEVSFVRSLYILALANFIFVIAAFYLTFSVGEFRVAASCSRYLEFSASCLLLAAVVKVRPRIRLFCAPRLFNALVFISSILILFRVYSGWKSFSSEDVQVRRVAVAIGRLLSPGDEMAYIDYTTRGYYPIKINYFLNRPMPLYYEVAIKDKPFEIPKLWWGQASIRQIMIIDLKTNLTCYKQELGIRQLGSHDAFLYLMVAKDKLPDFIKLRDCH